MKSFVALFSLVALACAAPQFQYTEQQPHGYQIPILTQTQEINSDGAYEYSYVTGNGIAVQEKGYLKNAGGSQVVQGSYSYTSPEGIPITLTYISDEKGFRAVGTHLPTSQYLQPQSLQPERPFMTNLHG